MSILEAFNYFTGVITSPRCFSVYSNEGRTLFIMFNCTADDEHKPGKHLLVDRLEDNISEILYAFDEGFETVYLYKS